MSFNAALPSVKTGILDLNTGSIPVLEDETGANLVTSPVYIDEDGNITGVNGISYATATATGATPLVVNARAGSAVFSSVSIAGGAAQTLVITNSTITGSSTQILYGLVGATTGAALTIQSVTNSAGSSSIVVINGTGATTTTANITLTFLVLN